MKEEDLPKFLSDEEREAVLGDEEGDEKTVEDAPTEDTEEVKEEIPDEAAKEAPHWEVADEPKTRERAETPPLFVPKYNADIPQGLDINAALDDVKKQFDDGDIDLDTYTQSREELLTYRVKQQIMDEINEQAPKQAWDAEQKYFFRQKDNQPFSNNPILRGALDQTLKTMSLNPKYADYTGIEALEEAKQFVIDGLSELVGTGQKVDTKTVQEVVKEAMPTVAAPKPSAKVLPISKKEPAAIPKTLGGIPAAAENVTKSKEDFTYLDDLTGEDFEREIAKLKPEQRRRYEVV